MKMEKRKFRIGELAKFLSVDRFVIRFWEKAFGIKASRSDGGQRCYHEKDIRKFEAIKDLLYTKGYTIAGAKKALKKDKDFNQQLLSTPHNIIASHITTMEPETFTSSKIPSELSQQIMELQKKLRKLQELL
ncbi:MAG: MerR family transcriptional regulator [Candidatus Babeliaceae bacterium]